MMLKEGLNKISLAAKADELRITYIKLNRLLKNHLTIAKIS